MEEQRRGNPTLLVVGDTLSANVQLNLGVQDDEAQQITSEIGQMDLLFYQACQEYLHALDPSLERIPMVQMSDLVEGDAEFKELQQKVFALARDSEGCIADAEFAEAAYGCVPRQLRYRRGKDRLLRDFEPGSPAYNHNWARTKYVLQQVAMTLHLGGTKLRHQKEEKYDAATKMAAQKLGVPIEDKPSFQDFVVPEIPLQNVAYRSYPARTLKPRPEVISGHQDLSPLSRQPDETIPKDRLQAMRPEEIKRIVLSRSIRAEEALWGVQSSLNRGFEIFCFQINLVDQSKNIPDDKKKRIKLVISIHQVQEMVRTLASTPHLWFLFKQSGVLAVLNGEAPICSLDNPDSLLPHECRRRTEESDEEYFIRFVNGLLANRRLCVINSHPSTINNTLGFRISMIAAYFQCGIDDREVDDRVLDYKAFYRGVFSPGILPLGPEVSEVEVERLRWEGLDSLVDLLDAEETGQAQLLVQSPVFSERLRECVAQALT